MPFVTTKELLLNAQKGGYAVGAFNVENMEMVQAVVSAAEEMNAPVICNGFADCIFKRREYLFA